MNSKSLLRALEEHEAAGQRHAERGCCAGTFHAEMREMIVDDFVAKVRQQTIEECAKVCDERVSIHPNSGLNSLPPHDAASIVLKYAAAEIRKLKG